jgi:sugar/nucleoside kinase (ribokinase family)
MYEGLTVAWPTASIGVIGNISRDLVSHPNGPIRELLGGAALHVALAANRAGLCAAPTAVIGTDLQWITRDSRLAALDLSDVKVSSGESCAFHLTYDAEGRLVSTVASLGVAEKLTKHALNVLTTRPAWHVCCRRPLDAALIFDHLASFRKPFTADFNLASARALMPAVRTVLWRASAVFVNAAELDILSQVTHLRDLCLVVVSDGPQPAVVLRRGQVSARVMPPQVAAAEVTGAGDVLTGTFLAAMARELDDQDSLQLAVNAATEGVTHHGLALLADGQGGPNRVLRCPPTVRGA